VQLDRAAVREPGVERRRQRGRLVDNQQVAGAQVVGQLAEPHVGERRALAGDHEPHGVARQPARLRGIRCLQRRGEVEGERRAHAAASASARAA
jgi:hypothetical protein